MTFDPNLVLIGVLVFLLAGTIKGTVGMGLPVAAVGILSQLIEPRTAVLLAVFPILFSNVWQVYRSGDVLPAIRRYGLFATVLAVSLFVTTFFAKIISEEMLLATLGTVIVLFAATSLAIKLPYLPERYDRLGQVVAGICSGVFGGLTAMWSPPMVIYFLARRLDKDEFVRASGILFLAGSVPLTLGYVHNGLITGSLAIVSSAMIVPTLVGFALGEALRRRLDASRFRSAVLVVFLIMGLNLLREAVF